MYQAGVDFGTISLTPILHGVVATVLYFLVGAAVLVAGFLMVNLLTPGDLRRLVFIDRRPNAVVLAATMYVRWPSSPSPPSTPAPISWPRA